MTDRHVRVAAQSGSYFCGQNTEGFCQAQPGMTCFRPSSQCFSGDLRWKEAFSVLQLGRSKVDWKLWVQQLLDEALVCIFQGWADRIKWNTPPP